MKITDVLPKRMTFSFEVFPPKTDTGMANLTAALPHFYNFQPDFISCTYGAGGTNAGRHLEVCAAIKADGRTEVLPHFTCIGNTREQIDHALETYSNLQIDNVLAMRGDLPAGWEGTNGDFSNADGLIKYVKTKFPDFCIAAACYPEKHLSAPSFSSDIAHLRSKQDNGAEFLISQLCHDSEAFVSFLHKIRKAHLTIPVVLGIMPVLNKDSIIRMTLSNGCSIPADLAAILGRYGDNPDDLKKAGIEYTVNQIHRFMASGIDGLHIYTLNKWEDVETIMAVSGIRNDITAGT